MRRHARVHAGKQDANLPRNAANGWSTAGPTYRSAARDGAVWGKSSDRRAGAGRRSYLTSGCDGGF